MADDGRTNIARYLESQFIEAWNANQTGHFEKANGISQTCLYSPALGTFFRAGFHFILAHSPHDPLDHANTAVILFHALLQDGPTDRDRASLLRWITQAEELKEALEASVQAAAKKPFTDELLHQMIDKAEEGLSTSDGETPVDEESAGQAGVAVGPSVAESTTEETASSAVDKGDRSTDVVEPSTPGTASSPPWARHKDDVFEQGSPILPLRGGRRGDAL